MLYIGRIGGNAVVMGEDDEGGKGGSGADTIDINKI